MALVALHVVAAALPWACRVDALAAIPLCVAALAMLPLSWRRLPGRGRVRGLAMEAGSVACRDASGWWPATLRSMMDKRAWASPRVAAPTGNKSCPWSSGPRCRMACRA